MRYKILAVDDDQLFLDTLKEVLRPLDRFELDLANGGAEAIAKIKVSPFSYAVVLLDFEMPGMNGSQTAAELLKINPKLIIAINSGLNSKDVVVDCMRVGAVDFFLKDEPSENLIKKLDSFCSKFEETGRILAISSSKKDANEEIISSIGMIGCSPQMADVATLLPKIAKESANVLVQGETGTGKELVSRAIHNLSPRKNRQFVAINVGAFSDTLLESELFGHIKGAFTGAIENKIGKFKLADGGTLFLDEIGDMKLELQVKLLRVLQEGEYYPVGSNKPEKVDVRIIAATHVNLEEAVKLGKFRQDLFYRLNVLNIAIPALRERPQDIRPLVLHFQKKYRLSGKVFLMRAIRRMEKYSWPGNIRELEGEVQKLAIVSEDAISDIHLNSKFFREENLATSEEHISSFEEIEILKDRLEKGLIEKSLKRTGKLTDAAGNLNIPISTLHKKMKKHNLSLEDFT